MPQYFRETKCIKIKAKSKQDRHKSNENFENINVYEILFFISEMIFLIVRDDQKLYLCNEKSLFIFKKENCYYFVLQLQKLRFYQLD